MRISDWSSDVCSSDLPAAIGLFGDRALLALLEHRGTAIEVDQRGAGVEVGHDPGIGVARRLARLAEFENLRDVAGDRQAVRPRRAGEGRAIAAVAAIADGDRKSTRLNSSH